MSATEQTSLLDLLAAAEEEAAAPVDALVDPALLHDERGRLRRGLPTADGDGGTFTDRQAEAIARRGPTLVSAGAGAGKTSVLVERYVRLLVEDETLDTGQILAITFTEKAAAEMRERARRRLDALLQGTETPERWRLEDAWIGTFHAVAQRLLRRHALAAGLDPDVAVIDGTRAAELRRTAYEQALRGWLRGDPDRDATLALDPLGLAGSYGLDLLRQETLALLDLRRTQGRDPADEPGLAVPAATPLPDGAATRGAGAVAALRDALRDARSEVGDALDAGPSAAARRAGEQLLELAVRIEADLDAAAGRSGGVPASSVVGEWIVPPRRSATVKGPACEALRAAVDDLARAARAAELLPRGEAEVVLREALLRATARRYRRLKRERSVVDFDDLLLGLLRLLRRRRDLAAMLRRRFRHVLVDEFQDTNPVQLELVALLSEPDRRFHVGDRLQAIYGFRHATVRGFDEAAAEAEAGGGRLALDETFRCPAPVLALTNRVGAAAHADYQPLVGGHERAPGDRRDAPEVEVHLVAESPEHAREVAAAQAAAAEESGGEPEPPPIDPDEAGHVAALVQELLDAGRRPGDIALLVRRTAPVAALERALLQHGIDAVPAVAAPLLEALEVRELEAWLRALANPRDDVALLGALRLPTAGVDADALVPLAAEHRAALEEARATGGEPPALWDTVRALDDREATVAMPDPARDELDLQVLALLRHRALARRGGPGAVLAEILADGAYRAAILARPGAARRWSAVQAFADWVEEQEAAGDDLHALVRRIADDRADGPSSPIVLDGAAVRISTIHRAKGLEWPVVICCDLGSRINADRPRVIVDPDPASARIGLRLGVGKDAVGLWDHDALKAEADRTQAEEERRLVHVALTRAKERLILCGVWPPEKAQDGVPATRLAPKGVPVGARPGASHHDLLPRTPPIRWLLPLVADAEAWPAIGEEGTLTVEDPTSGTRAPATVRLLVRDPRGPLMAPPLRPAGAPRPVERAREAGDGPAVAPHREPVPAAPAHPLPAAVSATSLAQRLGLGVHDDAVAAPEATVDPDAARRRGLLVHGLLEQRLAGGAGDLAALAADLELPHPSAGEEARARALADALAASPAAALVRAAPPQRRHVERDLLYELGGARPLVQGVVDAWIDHEDGSVTIVDWKTGVLGDVLGPAQALQRDVYALGALLTGAPAVEVRVVGVDADGLAREIVATIGSSELPALRERLAAAVDAAQEQPPPRA
ncbi:UvrD-helicase domain-containing protein [Patulibacter brassicae]|uniref:DNA 3'-5' helicase n=1 Tax=Patulibacter brassicae TaxID=1705717 RepID=A0ABU4VNT8_9ACTN|nr:UvrD-helicase domain-containing protein [Patulibacter brassicae]MDX8153002.1 UvrD-helicase domain-containing protein [Patulibacter brassicae]